MLRPEIGEEEGESLDCPNCTSKVAWNGTQFACLACTWTEFKEKPPPSPTIDIREQTPDKKEDRPN